MRDIINQPHKNIIQKNKLVHSLDKLIQDSNFIKSAPETKGRAKYKKWYYYKYKNGYFLNVVELTNGELRLHSIGEAIK